MCMKDPFYTSCLMHIIPSGELQGQHPQADHKGQTTQKSLPNDERLHLNGNDTVSNGHNEGEFIHAQNMSQSCMVLFNSKGAG